MCKKNKLNNNTKSDIKRRKIQFELEKYDQNVNQLRNDDDKNSDDEDAGSTISCSIVSLYFV